MEYFHLETLKNSSQQCVNNERTRRLMRQILWCTSFRSKTWHLLWCTVKLFVKNFCNSVANSELYHRTGHVMKVVTSHVFMFVVILFYLI
jgi:hypothetical protein